MHERLRILLVDDNPEDRLLVKRELKKEFTVESIEPTSQELFDRALENKHFDVIITDYQLHWTTGLDVLRAVKASHLHCPVIMFTATGSEEIAVAAMKEGLDDYIIKSVIHLIRLRASVRAVLEHARAKQRAAEIESRLDSLLSSLKVGVFQCSLQGRLLESNEAFRRILAIEPQSDGTGRDFRDFFADPSAFEHLCPQLLDGQSVHDFTTQLRRDDDTLIWVMLNLSPSQYPDGTAIFEGLLEDITERVTTEQQLRQAELELAHMARVSTMGELLSSIAHEINQPLNAIANFSVACTKYIEALGQENLTDVQGWIHDISEQAQRAAAIIRGIRRFVSRHEARPTRVDLHELLRDSLRLLEAEARRLQIALHSHLPLPGPQVLVNRVQIQQVIVNLVRNAFEATQYADGSSRSVEISTHIEGSEVQVAVQDHGIGLPQENSESIFKPFVTTKAEGLGMGLPISSTLVKEHGGRLWATTNPEGGATFYFALPLAWRS